MRVEEATSVCESTRQMYMLEREREINVCVCEKEVKVGMSERMRDRYDRGKAAWEVMPWVREGEMEN